MQLGILHVMDAQYTDKIAITVFRGYWQAFIGTNSDSDRPFKLVQF